MGINLGNDRKRLAHRAASVTRNAHDAHQLEVELGVAKSLDFRTSRESSALGRSSEPRPEREAEAEQGRRERPAPSAAWTEGETRFNEILSSLSCCARPIRSPRTT